MLVLTTKGQNWVRIADFPGTPRDDGTGFFLNGLGYFGLGIDNGYLLRNDFFSYSTIENEWQASASLPGMERQYSSAFTVGNCTYLIGGAVQKGNTNEIWRYCTDGLWKKLTDAPFEARAAAAGFVLGKFIYYGTGRDTLGKLQDFWRFDTSVLKWEALGKVPFEARDEAIGFSTSTNGYLLMGNGHNCYKEVWKYSPLSESWSNLPDFPGQACKYAAGIDIEDKLIVAGGQSADNWWLNEAWMFDGKTEDWTALPSFPAYRRGMDGFSWKGHAVFCTGLDSTLARSNECWKISLGAEEELLPFPNPAVETVYVPLMHFDPGMMFQIEIHDLTGRLVVNETYQLVYDVVQVSLELPSGIYFITYTDGGKLFRYPLIVTSDGG